jgi:serine/threonine protein kinase
MATDSTDLVGVVVGGRYLLEGHLGAGAMGRVFRARHLDLDKLFALKVIAPAFALDAAARARFDEEAKLASQIAHPNIVAVTDYGEDPVVGAYMVMELVEGVSLVEEATHALPVRRACDLLGQIADALDHVHRRGIVHGDVKADNIMLTEDASAPARARRTRIARLLDFGLARRSGGESEDSVSGSPHYIAPELATGAAPSVASDVYALGVLAYLLLTGTMPFDGPITAILAAHLEQLPEAPSYRRELDPALDRLILRALAKDPARRHGSASAFRYELNTVIDMVDADRRNRARGTTSPTTSRDATIVAAYERSMIPQALLSLDGTVVFANKAFQQLLGLNAKTDAVELAHTPLPQLVPGIARAIRAVHATGAPTHRHARIYRDDALAPLHLTLWLAPLALEGSEVHVMIRVDEEDPSA